jgi:hypothetical protein
MQREVAWKVVIAKVTVFTTDIAHEENADFSLNLQVTFCVIADFSATHLEIPGALNSHAQVALDFDGSQNHVSFHLNAIALTVFDMGTGDVNIGILTLSKDTSSQVAQVFIDIGVFIAGRKNILDHTEFPTTTCQDSGGRGKRYSSDLPHNHTVGFRMNPPPRVVPEGHSPLKKNTTFIVFITCSTGNESITSIAGETHRLLHIAGNHLHNVGQGMNPRTDIVTNRSLPEFDSTCRQNPGLPITANREVVR